MTVSGFTLISRLLGFLRDIMIARFLGTGLVADAFFAAFRFPNLFRRIFGEGAFNAAFVPMFGKKVVDDREEGMRFASKAFSMLFVILGVFTVVAIPAMPLLMNVVVPGFKARDLDPSFFGKEKTVVLSEKVRKLEVGTKGARAMFYERLNGGTLEIQKLGFGEEKKTFGSLFGKQGETNYTWLGEPVSEADALETTRATVLGPLEVKVPKGLSEEEAKKYRETEEKKISPVSYTHLTLPTTPYV